MSNVIEFRSSKKASDNTEKVLQELLEKQWRNLEIMAIMSAEAAAINNKIMNMISRGAIIEPGRLTYNRNSGVMMDDRQIKKIEKIG